jgi:hypothetical protein
MPQPTKTRKAAPPSKRKPAMMDGVANFFFGP